MAGVAPAAPAPTFEALKWTEPGAEYAVLSKQPETCITYQRSAKNGALIDGGQALFNTPTLLGGQAAKAGVSCASCHSNGRTNPHFQLSNISDIAGTADVTSSFFSATRGNAKLDPVPIPDLTAPGKVSRDAATKALEPFIRNLIVEEFSGGEPSPDMLLSLASYVRAIGMCDSGGDNIILRQLSDQSALIDSAIRGHAEMARLGDGKSARLLTAAVRHQLQLINERYAGPNFVSARKDLLSASKQLHQISAMDELATQVTALKSWQSEFKDGLLQRLIKGQQKSLYNPERLAKAFPPKGVASSKP